MKYYLLILMITINSVCLLGLTDNSNYLDSTDDKYRITKEVYGNIIRAIGDGRRVIPILRIFKDYQKVECTHARGAWIWTCDGIPTIHFEEILYDMCQSLGPERNNAIAYILCHELAHYFKGHLEDYKVGWVKDYGNGLELTSKAKVKRNIPKDTIIFIESEADEFAGFYSYVANYDCRNVLGSLIDSIYDWLSHLPEPISDNDLESSGYLSRSDRKDVANKAAETLKELIPVFDAGNYLLMIKKYEQAAICFEYVAQFFPSREIYNNLGVCYAELSLSNIPMNDKRRKLIFPFSFDTETLIGERIGLKGIPENYFAKAEKAFNDAIRKDFSYASAKVNLACVKVLQKDMLGARNLIDSIINFNLTRHPDDNLLSNCYAVRGIVNYLENDVDKAKTDFLQAQIFGNPFAQHNFEICNNTSSSTTNKKESLNLVEEEVCGNTAYPARWINADLDKTIKTVKISRELKLNIVTKFPSCAGYYVEYKTNPDSKTYDDVYRFLITKPNYKGTTAKGIKIDDSIEKVKNNYGEPNYILSSIQGNLYIIYEREIDKLNRGIIFKFNKQNKLIGWIVYCK